MNLGQAIHTFREKSEQANELHRLRDRVEELEQLLGVVSGDAVDRFIAMKLTPGERRLVNILFGWKVVRRDRLFVALYGGRIECDQPEIQTLDVVMCRVRKYLAGFDIAINTERNVGWFMTPENKQKLSKLADWLLSGEQST